MNELVNKVLDAPLNWALFMEVRAWEAHRLTHYLTEGLNAFVKKQITNYTGK
jgi:hypothetical protein